MEKKFESGKSSTSVLFEFYYLESGFRFSSSIKGSVCGEAAVEKMAAKMYRRKKKTMPEVEDVYLKGDLRDN